MENIESFFYDKKLCDSVRYIVKNSSTTIDDAVLFMKLSNDYKRDKFIITKLSNEGFDKYAIQKFISVINKN